MTIHCAIVLNPQPRCEACRLPHDPAVSCSDHAERRRRFHALAEAMGEHNVPPAFRFTPWQRWILDHMGL